MSGVRLLCRGNHVVFPGAVRCLFVVAALLAADAGHDWPVVFADDSKSGSKVVDPFLTEDTDAPAGEEIPAIPEADPQIRPKARLQPALDDAPKMEAPRLKRDIKQTAVPKPDTDPALDPGMTGKKMTPSRLPPLKNSPVGGQPGWKSTSLDPASQTAASPANLPGPKSESARFEKEVDLDQLSEPLADVVIEGNKSIKTEEIMKLLKTRKGRVPDPRQIKEDVRTLASKRGWFFNVEVRIARTKDGKGQVLVFRVLEKPMLQKVTYTGNKKFKDKALTELTGLKVGAGYDVGSNREAARRIENHYRDKGYLHAKVELEKGNSLEDREVIFKIEEGPKVVVTKISFKGNKFVESGVLKTRMKTKTQILWLFGGKYDPTTVPEDKQALRQYYQGLGFFDVTVTENEMVSTDKANVHIEYTIDEGMRYKVRNIEFLGNRVLSAQNLLKDMKVHPNEYFNERFLNHDKEKIEIQYGDLGRIFATVEPKTRTPEEPGSVDLVYMINEDQPYRIGPIHVHIQGEHPHTKESTILHQLTFRPGDLASRTKMKQSEQRLKNTQIFAGGQPGAQGDPPRIDVPFPDGSAPRPRRPQNLARGQNAPPDTPPLSRPKSVKSSKPVKASAPVKNPVPAKTSATGNVPAPGSVSVPIAQPSRFSQSEDEEPVLFRRPNFGLEDPAEEKPFIFRGQNAFGDDEPEGFGSDTPPGGLSNDPFMPDDQPPAYIEPQIYVTEGQTGRLSFGVGINSNLGLIGNATLQENNFDIARPPTSIQDIIDGTAFRGGGQQFNLQAMPGLYFSQYSAGWTDPYFLDQDIVFGVNGKYFTRFYQNWTENREGGSVRLGHQFSPYLSGSVVVRAENVMISNPSVPTPIDISSVLGNNFLSTARVNAVHDTRDSSFLPGSGHYLEAAYEQGIANFVYPKVDVTAKQYFLVKERPDGGSRQIISLSGTFGWTGSQTPFFERYYAGGFSSFRGFYFYGVTPTVNGVRIGGFFQALGSLEYLYPITADNTVQIVTFTDFGTVDSTVSLNAFRMSVGAGFRLTVPMMGPVPIAVDFAVPLLKQSFDTTQIVSFSLGLLR